MSNTTETKVDTIKITIGGHTQQYYLWKTSAPKAYDGFGTFTVQESGLERWVLAPVEHADWQESRYASGLHRPEKMEEIDGLMEGHIIETLLRRLRGED